VLKIKLWNTLIVFEDKDGSRSAVNIDTRCMARMNFEKDENTVLDLGIGGLIRNSLLLHPQSKINDETSATIFVPQGFLGEDTNTFWNLALPLRINFCGQVYQNEIFGEDFVKNLKYITFTDDGLIDQHIERTKGPFIEFVYDCDLPCTMEHPPLMVRMLCSLDSNVETVNETRQLNENLKTTRGPNMNGFTAFVIKTIESKIGNDRQRYYDKLFTTMEEQHGTIVSGMLSKMLEVKCSVPVEFLKIMVEVLDEYER
jgi:hypothetical protein